MAKSGRTGIENLVSTLMGGDLSMLNSLSSVERGIAEALLASYADTGELPLDQMWQVDYEFQPPTFKEWLSSPDYFGHVGEDLYPKWRDELDFFFDPRNGKCELILRGSIGTGKTFVGALCCCYVLTLLMIMKSPQRTFNHSDSAQIFLGLVSADLGQAERGLWGYTLQMLKHSPFFRKFTDLKEDQDYKGLGVKFPKGIYLIGGSNASHILGTNLIFGCIDETNFRRTADPQAGASELYERMKSRVENRFVRPTNGHAGWVVLISSEAGSSSFLNQHCNKLKHKERETGHSEAHICQFSEWEIKGDRLNLCGRTFTVDIGDQLKPPAIVDDLRELRPGAKTIQVPVEYRKAAERSLMDFLQNIAGVVPGRGNKYFHNAEALNSAFVRVNPALSDVCEMALDTEYDIVDFIDLKKLVTKIKGKYQPLNRPGTPRHLHIDLSKNQDLTGLAMAYIGEYTTAGMPKACQELGLSLMASKHKPIDYDKIIAFIVWLRDVGGFIIGSISYDAYQSQHSMNALEKKGFKVFYRSMDRMKSDTGKSKAKVQPEYALVRNMLSEGRVEFINSKEIQAEAVELLDLDGYPDHPETGKKDALDAAVGALCNAIDSVADEGAATEEPVRPPKLEMAVRWGDRAVYDDKSLTAGDRSKEDEFTFEN